MTLDNLETNAYGYTLSTTAINDSSTYSHVPTSSTVIYNKPSNADGGTSTGDYPYGDEYYLGFGTKIGTTLPAGTYAGIVTVSAVANPITVTSLYDISIMQEMTSAICENTKEHYTKQLIDIRDGKSYWVAKLKDGNCWMTQNLALDLGVDADGNAMAVSESGINTVMDATNTDISEKWNADTGFSPRKTNSFALIGNSNGNNTLTLSWNIGDIVLATPEYGKQCNEKENGASAMSTDNVAKVCENSGLVEVTDEWRPTFIAADGNYTLPDGTIYSGLVSVDLVSRTYDAHYLLGNYYQGSTSRVGQPKKSTGVVNSSGSICPAGWSLPTAMEGSFADNTKGSFAYLFKVYGLATSDKSGIFVNSAYNIVGDPLYLVNSGETSSYYGYLYDIGGKFRLYSGTLNGIEMTYSATHNSRGELTSSQLAYNNIGSSVRCVAK